MKDRFEEAREWLSTRPEAVEFFCNLFVEGAAIPPLVMAAFIARHFCWRRRGKRTLNRTLEVEAE